MKIYLICPVRNVTPELQAEIETCVQDLETQGYEVHFPPRDVDQNDPTGMNICRQHLAAMKWADKVAVYWDQTSSGSHFDLGMAYALGKPVDIIHLCQPDGPGKSYIKVMQAMQGGDYSLKSEDKAGQKAAQAAPAPG